MTSYKQGDIVLVYFPDSNLLTVKKRPAIVLQANNLRTGLSQVIIGMVTTNLDRKDHSSRIFVDISNETGKKTGLLSNSVIMTDNVATVKISEIYKKFGEYIEKEILYKALKYTFGI